MIKRRLKKKAIMLKSIVRIIIVIIFLSSAVALGKSIIRVRGQSERSFNELVKLIEKINIEGGTESMNLVMDKNTALIGFTSNSEYIKNTRKYTGTKHYFWRPNHCEKNKACVCLCKSGWEKLSENPKDNPHNVPNEYECEKIICKSIDSVNFMSTIKSEDFGAYVGNPFDLDVEDLEGVYELEGGFIYLRTTDTGMGFPGWSTRNNQIYVEGYGNIGGVCFELPCISKELKKQIDTKTS